VHGIGNLTRFLGSPGSIRVYETIRRANQRDGRCGGAEAGQTAAPAALAVDPPDAR
jgi:hypothetical protein